MLIRTKLLLLPAIVGGRNSAISTGYRPDWILKSNEKMLHCAQVTVSTTIEPGWGGDANLTPLVPKFWADVKEGQQIQMYEGSTLVGVAKVLAVDE